MLKDHILKFIQHKDLITRSIIGIDELENAILVTHTKKTHFFLILENLTTFDEIKDNLSKKEATSYSIVCKNTQKNIDFLIEHWKEFLEFKITVSIYFVNEKSTADKQWVIFPKSHALICEKVKDSVKALSANVDLVKRS